MKLPAYPLITVDPFFSIWSSSDNLYDSDTKLWCGIKKRLTGEITVDGTTYRFMGSGNDKVISQTSLTVSPFVTTYVFQQNEIRLSVSFRTPLIFDELQIFSMPCSFVDYDIEVLDNMEHIISLNVYAGNEFAYNKTPKAVVKTIENYNDISYIKFGCKNQTPLSHSGDSISADWGYVCIWGGEYSFSHKKSRSVCVSNSVKTDKGASFTHIFAYDDVFSIEYFGEMLKGLWHEKFDSIGAAIEYCIKNKTELYEQLSRQEMQFVDDAKLFGESYVNILSAAVRQVLAAHKLVKSSDGTLLYLSKECHSNGCINTVDVSYPAMPLFLIYKPELVRAMLDGVFSFASMPLWQADFAPHDIGRYPHADGQVYSIKDHCGVKWRDIFKSTDFSIYRQEYQMPVEECGNMIIMSYAYFNVSNDREWLERRFDVLKGWADYLIGKGVVLDNQLCTDDFAGHSEKNVNLAIKSIMALASFARVCEALGKDAHYADIAREFAEQLVSLTDKNGYLSFAVGNDESWSLKYNMVWDIVFGFNLFDKKIYKAESEKYRQELEMYGVPLDFRKPFTKTDWMLWAATLDASGENIRLFSDCIVKYLAQAVDGHCFSDWYYTHEPKDCGFNHRSVQGGLWMPVLKEKLDKTKRDSK